VWTGLFILLAAGGIVLTRGLWAGALAALLNVRAEDIPQADIVWTCPGPAGSLCAVSPSGRVLLVGPPPNAGDGTLTGVTVIEAGRPSPVASFEGLGLEVSFFPSGFQAPPGGRAYTPEDWRLLVARTPPTDTRSWLTDEVICIETGGKVVATCKVAGAVVTAACAWVDEADILLGLFEPAADPDERSRVIALAPDGTELWSRCLGSAPAHRLAARPGTGFVAAATLDTVALLDSHGTRLWAVTLRTSVTDMALGSRGVIAVATDTTLLAYDRRGNLMWRKRFPSTVRATAAAGGFVAAATDRGVTVYDEDGLAKWHLTCAASPRDIAFDQSGRFLAVVCESGVVILARAPGSGAATLPPGVSDEEARVSS